MERQADPSTESRDLLCIQLLGGFRVTYGRRAVVEADFRVRNAARLVKLLALAPDHARHRDEIADWLWPNLDRDAAANNLRYTLYIARRVIRPLVSTPDDILRLSGEHIQLAPASQVRTDVGRFEHALALARRAGDLKHWNAAVQIYAGELLPDDRYEDWAAPRRESLREAFLQALTTFAYLSDEAGDDVSAVEAFERAVELDAAREEAYVGLMRLYALRGRRQLALRQYARLRDALLSELDVEPEPISQQLYQAILVGRFPPGSGMDPAPVEEPEPTPSGRNNLPDPQDSFVGRNREIEDVSALLQATRFLSLIGSGGIGKTRLALQVARRRATNASDDVWFIDLAALTGTAGVHSALAMVLDIPETPGRDAVDRLVDALQPASCLLILDNCEHLIDAVAGLASELIQRCPGVRILATSREPLRVSGEVTFRVPPLGLPIESTFFPAELAGPAESVQLFVSRATRHQRGFQLSPENASIVAGICRSLEGIPLAIELAAARVATTPLEEISARLGNVLHLLTASNRSIPARQQTLRGALDWSYDLLSDAEQRLFRALSVFAGGWTIEAAEVVGADDDARSRQVIELLASLVDRSLVTLDAHRLGLRYRMLEPVRQYAAGRLRDAGEISSARNRHARFMREFVTAGEPGLRGASQGEWINRFEAEHDNLRTALHWSLESDPDTALHIAAGAGRFWYIRSHGVEGRAMLRAALDAAPQAETLTRARAMAHAGVLADEAGDQAQAACHLEAALDIFRAAGDERGMATALNSLGAVERSRGDHERARQRFEESLALRQKLGDEQAVNLVKSNLAAIAMTMGDLERAEALLEETMPYERATGDEWSLAISLAYLGRIAWERGDYLRAGDRFVESSVLALRAGDRGAAAEGIEGVAGTLGALGQATLAARLWGAAEETRRQINLPVPAPDLPFHERMIDTARASATGSTFDDEWARGRRIPMDDALALAQEAVAGLHNRSLGNAAALTPREQEIVDLIVQGRTNAQIALALGIAVRTVDTHVGRILRKLGVSSRTAIAATQAGSDRQ